MPFRNPTTTLPADAIEGPIQGSQLAADAIDGKVITGSTVRTSATGRRIVMTPDGRLELWSGLPGETPGVLEADLATDGEMSMGRVRLVAPTHGPSPAELLMATGPTGDRQYRLGPLMMVEDPDAGTAFSTLAGSVTLAGDVSVGGRLTHDPDWSQLAFATGWTGYGGVFGSGRYIKHADGTLQLRDLVQRTATGAIPPSETIAVLPLGYRPPSQYQTWQHIGNGGGILALNVTTTGSIVISSLNATAETLLRAGGYVSLNDVRIPLA
ncbi:hypothetical protein [Streptomyces sp. NPDC004726]